jgi:hypothetical protein
MKYMLFIIGDDVENPGAPDVFRREMPRWLDEMEDRGVREQGHALAAPSAATTVSVRGGETLVVDGPFAETKEHIAGFDIIECADLDEAIEIAAKHPVSWFNRIEIRPFHDFEAGGARD